MSLRSKVSELLFSREKLELPVHFEQRSIQTKEELKRVKPNQLEKLYALDAVIFNGVNQIENYTLGSGIRIDATSPSIREFFEDFAKRVQLEVVLGKVVRFLCIYGNAYVEPIWNKTGTNITDLILIDPKTMDFQRNTMGEVLLDEQKKPKGYEQTVNHKKVKFAREEIVHFKLYTVGDSLLGIGLLEPLYKQTIIKLNLEEALGENAHRHGFPIIWAQIGDAERPETHPTQEQINKLGETLRNIDYLTEIVTPYHVKLNMLQPEQIGELRQHLDYYTDLIAAGMGVPKTILLGGAERASRAAAQIQIHQFERTIRSLQQTLSRTVEQFLFEPLCKKRGFRECPRLGWNEISPEDLNAKAERLKHYVASGLLTPDEDIEALLRKTEHLPEKTTKKLQELRELWQVTNIPTKIERELIKDLVDYYDKLEKKTMIALRKAFK